jgi:hypothetical protein
VVAATGSFAAMSTLLGSPLAGAFLLLEASAVGGVLATAVLLPGLLSAGIGARVFTGHDSLTGYGTFSLAVPNLPPAGQLCAGLRRLAMAVRDRALIRGHRSAAARRRPVRAAPFVAPGLDRGSRTRAEGRAPGGRRPGGAPGKAGTHACGGDGVPIHPGQTMTTVLLPTTVNR